MSQLITIYRYNTTDIRAVIDPDDRSAQDTGIMRGDTVTLTFTSFEFFDFKIGDYCTIYGSKYRMNRDAVWTRNWKRSYSYTLTLEGQYFQLSRVQYLTLNANNNFTEGKFTLRAKPADFLDLVVSNMNRVFPSEGWQAGFVIDADFQQLDFAGENCLQALTKMADAFGTEFLINGNKINLIQSQPSTGIVLEYGKGKALYNITKANQDNYTGIVTRLYAYGSSKNLGDNYRSGAPSLRMADSLFVERSVATYGLYEATIYFDGNNGTQEIYPHRTGVVSAVSANDTFIDAAIDFDVNDQLIPGVTAKLTFNTGLLAGTVFEIHSFDNATKTFVINPNTSSQTITLPNDDLHPAIGDTYVLTDIIMPLSYVTSAEAALKLAAQKYISTRPGPVFTVACNPRYFKATAVPLQLGGSLTLLMADAAINRPIRLMGFNRSLRNPWLFNSLTLADTVIPQVPAAKLLKSI